MSCLWSDKASGTGRVIYLHADLFNVYKLNRDCAKLAKMHSRDLLYCPNVKKVLKMKCGFVNKGDRNYGFILSRASDFHQDQSIVTQTNQLYRCRENNNEYTKSATRRNITYLINSQVGFGGLVLTHGVKKRYINSMPKILIPWLCISHLLWDRFIKV